MTWYIMVTSCGQHVSVTLLTDFTE